MPDRSSRNQASFVIGGAVLLACSALLYFALWHLLDARQWTARWLAPTWVGATYGLLGLAFYGMVVRPSRGRDRRTTPRVPVALPVRYSTEEGQVGVGVLHDLTRQGAGLLVPNGAVESELVWLQFIGFDDYTAIRGRVMYTHEAGAAVRLGLALDPLPAETSRLLSEFLIPFGRETLMHLGEARPRVAGPWPWWRRRRAATSQRHHLPVLVEQGVLKVWAVTQAVTDDGAVLLLPQGLAAGEPVRIAAWGSRDTRQCRIVRCDVLERSPFPITRVVVRFEKPSRSPREASAASRAPHNLGASPAVR